MGSAMPETDDLFEPAPACPRCPPDAPKPVLVIERFGVKRFFCPQCEHVWEEPSGKR
jgi:hypothetical protein